MNDHEKLKEIINELGSSPYELWLDWDWYNHYFWKELKWWIWWLPWFKKYDVKEIIFTKEFMDTLFNWSRNMATQTDIYSLLHHLDNPIDYLYKILWLNTK